MFTKSFCQRNFFEWKMVRFVPRDYAKDPGAWWVATREQCSARSRANWRDSVVVGREDSLASEAIKVRGVIAVRTGDAKIAIAKIIGDDEDDILMRNVLPGKSEFPGEVEGYGAEV